MLGKIMNSTDEMFDRASNIKIQMIRQAGQLVMPPGYWGTSDGNFLEAGHDADFVIGAEGKKLYLTFDDGPCPRTTPALLAMLEEAQVKASFFLIGSRARRYPHLVEAIHKAGHTIGNHSFNHLFLPLATTGFIEREINATNHEIAQVTGTEPLFFRPPFGMMDKRAHDCLSERGMKAIYWSCAPEDWERPGTHRIIRRVMWTAGTETLLVLHEGKKLEAQTISVAKEIICRFRDLGFDLETVDTCA